MAQVDRQVRYVCEPSEGWALDSHPKDASEVASHCTKRTSAIQHFLRSASGAVTVDWVVLTAAVLVAALGVTIAVSDNVLGVRDEITTDLAETPEKVDAIQQTVAGPDWSEQ